MPLKVGDLAPDFELPAVTGEEKSKFRLSNYRGKKNVLIAFYPLDWTPVWTEQMPGYKKDMDKFTGLDTQVVGISVDSIPSHLAWQRLDVGMMNYPLCSDFYPHGAVAIKYGLLREGPPIPGINERAIFIVDKHGKIAFERIYDLGEQPDNEEVLEVLKKL